MPKRSRYPLRLVIRFDNQRQKEIQFHGTISVDDQNEFNGNFDVSQFFYLDFIKNVPAFIFMTIALYHQKHQLYMQYVYWNDLLPYLVMNTPKQVCFGQLKSYAMNMKESDSNDFDNKFYVQIEYQPEFQRILFRDFFTSFVSNKLYYL